MGSKIEQCIDEIEEYIAGCKYQAFSNSKIIVDKDEMEELLTELRRKAPDEIRRYQKMISNKEAILADAQAKADAIIAKAEVHTTELVSEHQIMQQAYAQADEIVLAATNKGQSIVDEANQFASIIQGNALQYVDNLLQNMEGIIINAIDTTKARSDNLMASLQDCFQTINANRRELLQQGVIPVEQQLPEEYEDDEE